MLQQKNQQIWQKIDTAQADVIEYSQKLCQTGSWLYLCETGEYWLSEELYRILQLPQEATITSKLFLSFIHPDDLLKVKESFLLFLQDRKSYHLVHRLVINEDIKWLEVSAEFVISPTTKQPYVIGTARDISVFKQQQSKLERKQLAFNTIANYLAQMPGSTDWQSIIKQADQTIQQVLPVVTTAIFLLQDNWLVPILPHYAHQLETKLKQSAENFLATRAVETGEVQNCPITCCLNKPLADYMYHQGITGVIAIPIKNCDKTIAVLSLFTPKGGCFTENEWEFCQIICGHLAIQLQNVMLYTNLKKELYYKIAAQEDLNTVFNESLDFIVLIDAQGRLKKFNPSFIKKLGYTFQELLYTPIINLISPEERCYARYVFSNLAHTGSIRGLCQPFLCKNGDIIYLEINAQYIEGSSNILATARDITEQKKRKELHLALEKSITAEKLKSEFFANMSHDFKTPLNIILSYLQLLKIKLRLDQPTAYDNDYQKYCEYIEQNSYKLLRLASNLLDATQIDNEFLDIYLEKHNIRELLGEIVSSTECYAYIRGISLDYQAQLSGEHYYYCDQDKITRILLNLLSNAIKNTLPGGAIHVRLNEDADFLIVEVSDTGCGIAEEVLPHIFEKFCFREACFTRSNQGSGISLSIVKSFVEMHQGHITVKSKQGEGCIFRFTLAKNLQPTEENQKSKQVYSYQENRRSRRIQIEMADFASQTNGCYCIHNHQEDKEK